MDYCLREAGITTKELDLVGFYEKPLVKFDRLLETYAAYAPRGWRSFLMAMPMWLSEKLWMAGDIKDQLEGYEGEVFFGDHHESHAASAFYPSPFEQAAIVTMDGVGEWATSSIGVGRGSEIEMLRELRFPHSLGLLYSAFTYFAGFRVNSGEYKVMGLAPYGEPRFVKLLKDHVIEIRDDGSLWMNMEYFTYPHGLTMTGQRPGAVDWRAGAQAREQADPARDGSGAVHSGHQRRGDVEDDGVRAPRNRHARPVPGRRRGAELRRQRPHPSRRTVRSDLDSAGGRRCRRGAWRRPRAVTPLQAGAARQRRSDRHLGAAVDRARYGRHSSLCRRHERVVSRAEVRRETRSRGFVAANGYNAHRYEPLELADRIAALMAQEKVVGLFQGRMEFGPRALGGRSIIGDARSPKMQSVMNVKIKFRESFRPFAPAVLRERVHDWFELDGESPYMLLVADVQPSRRLPVAPETEGLWGIDKLNVPRSTVPAITHVDYSARVQTVRREANPLYYDIIKAFERRTGCPVIVNTSFNVRGEPIVGAPEDAYRCFMRTDMDVLVLENFILEKAEQAPVCRRHLVAD